REALLRRDLEEQGPFCVLAHMVGPMSHEMQNVFNNIVLQAAILSRDLSAQARADADVFRRVGQQASGMMRRLHDYLYPIPLPRRAGDRQGGVADALDRLPGGGDGVERGLAPSRRPAVGNEALLVRLVRLLVGSARGVLDASGGGTVTVRTRAEGGKVSLRV